MASHAYHKSVDLVIQALNASHYSCPAAADILCSRHLTYSADPQYAYQRMRSIDQNFFLTFHRPDILKKLLCPKSAVTVSVLAEFLQDISDY